MTHMTTHAKEVLDAEKECSALKELYESAMRTFLIIPQDAAHVTKRREALQDFHSAGVNYFNAFEKLISLGSLCGADKDATWYTDKAETSVNLLDTIASHFQAVFAKADELHLSRDVFKPSRTSFANMQRLVQLTHEEHAGEQRALFATMGLPTHGFDKEESEKPATRSIEWRYFIVGCIFGFVTIGLAVWGFSLDEMKPHQYWILRWAMPFAGAFASGSFSGAIVTGGKKFWWGLAVAATGGFAVWLLSNLFLLKS